MVLFVIAAVCCCYYHCTVFPGFLVLPHLRAVHTLTSLFLQGLGLANFKVWVFLYLFFFQIKEESFLEDVNNLLNAGEVPNLFPLDEKQEICEKMRVLDRFVASVCQF